MSSVFSLNALEPGRNFSRAYRPNAGVARFRCAGEAAVHHMNDDTECMARLAAGDANALRELYQRHGRALLRFSSAMCRSRQSAEDMVHDTFVALLREPMNFDPALGTQHREVISLCDLEELPYTTVAGILSCPVGTVRSRLHRARALLTLRLASLELIDLQTEPTLAQRGLS
jgi:DNA-directed RNA polymerase specialized sigma24 family protein